MKTTLVLIFTFFMSLGFSFSQSIIDKTFAKYSGQPGFTSVSISPELFKLISLVDDKDEDIKMLSEKIVSLKILVSEDKVVGFTNEVREYVSGMNYKSIMQVIDGSQKIDFYAKEDGGTITDLIMLAIDGSEEIMLSLSGSFKLDELANLGKSSDNSGVNGLTMLKNLENNSF